MYQLFPQIEEAMVQPLRESRDRYEELKQIDDAMNEVGLVFCRQKKKVLFYLRTPTQIEFVILCAA